MTQLAWLRNDLRTTDHPAFQLALARSTPDSPVAAVHIATPAQWQQHNESPAKLGLRAALLQDLQQQLNAHGVKLYLLETDDFSGCPELLTQLCGELNCRNIHWLTESPLDENLRDIHTRTQLQSQDIQCHIQPVDQLVSTVVLNQQDQPYKVFTPFYKRWLQILQQQDLTPITTFPTVSHSEAQAFPLASWAGTYRDDLWPADQASIHRRLMHFCQHKLAGYGDKRDIPSEPATSQISPYLALGAIGPREIVSAMRSAEWGADYWLESDWLRELAWRDFYRQLLIQFPAINKHKPFKADTDQIRWQQNDAHWQAWCTGRTGFPIIDAAMRQLLQTGWMHNRLRMLTASFLTKLLFQDWRRGEAFFMQHLVDGDFAANNGGWQWSASVGCDAAPYFRVFNPLRQSEKFDPEGLFIRRFLPELASLDDKTIHNPSREQRQNCGYPEAIIDYSSARQYAIDAFKQL
ncbi:cryptochrome/photolyase family protein [Aliamphritea spongicola]|uniref:cryptochrome/photolyase family protein n=1 Tax=Aliamphritea spongicola TaxID=707589 RepID=UPI00196AEE97|nr:deoxyribodipyrimidine photo-lyase [Aliamphritea spongicola]MBN3563902.1 deoxyribodipyrimidine photo-lyase [Aliamphritea spongicola]